MKKLTLILLIMSSVAIADEHHHSRHNDAHQHQHQHQHQHYKQPYYSDSDDWMLPAIIGSVIGGAVVYGYSRPPAPVYYPQVPVYQQQPPIYQPVPYGYHQQSVFDPNCNCYKYALIPN